ncbi:hypothetical protein AA105894_2695 [Asaia spathodeae NBRC 105894]|nr:hypothetical protein AA105894_2695 [Asaia spathodeae NBRC 105894]
MRLSLSLQDPAMTTHAIKTATQAVIRAVGGVDAAASFVRVGRSQLSDYQNRHSPSVVPVDVAIEMDRCAQEPVILAAMALAEGYILTPLKVGQGDLATDIEKVSHSFNETISTTLRVLADGVVEPHEVVAMRATLSSLHHAVGQALHNLRATDEKPAPAALRGVA